MKVEDVIEAMIWIEDEALVLSCLGRDPAAEARAMSKLAFVSAQSCARALGIELEAFFSGLRHVGDQLDFQSGAILSAAQALIESDGHDDALGVLPLTPELLFALTAAAAENVKLLGRLWNCSTREVTATLLAQGDPESGAPG